MRKVEIIKGDPYPIEVTEPLIPQFEKEDYYERIELLAKKMEENDISHVILYADREHFPNMEYLIGFDPRFEEALLVMSQDKEITLLTGNEGYAYSFVVPVKIKRILYQNFSLQGQPRDRLRYLSEIFADCGINNDSRIGVIGSKYFEPEHLADYYKRVDIPSYIIDELTLLVKRTSIINFTRVMTDLEDGIRMVLRNAKEIAYYEYVANKASNAMIRLLKGLKIGMTELEASANAGYDAWPICMFPIVNFGDRNVSLGLRSPGQRKLKEGDMFTSCYGLRGSLIARSGLAVSNEKYIPAHLQGVIESFYKPYFRAIAAWYEGISIGVSGEDVYRSVMDIIGDADKFGVGLNPGHNIGADEWTNSPFFEGSKHTIKSGFYLQCDIIASVADPLRQAIVEDGIIVADKVLQESLKSQYPDVFERIMKRKEFVRDVLGIAISDDVLPLSNAQAVLHPYLLDINRFFSIETK